MVEIPHAEPYLGASWWQAGHPAWEQPVDSEGKKLKPIIRCNCGEWSGIGLHHVHADGRLLPASFTTPRRILRLVTLVAVVAGMCF